MFLLYLLQQITLSQTASTLYRPISHIGLILTDNLVVRTIAKHPMRGWYFTYYIVRLRKYVSYLRGHSGRS